jgi:phosphoribosylformylglycinamidine synthase II/formyltetrahydrofolate-dependent phosphoribosylglycinamide formyltransferase
LLATKGEMTLENKKNIALFASGTGSNALNLIQYANDKEINISCLVCDVKDAPIISKAKELGVPTHIISPDLDIDDKKTRKEQHEKIIIETLESYNVEWILLAGYMRLLSEKIINHFYDSELNEARIINIHPSLLPDHRGLNAYENAFADDKDHSGVTLHFVNNGMDTGNVILQETFPKRQNDTLDVFKARGLALEHQLYPKIIDKIINNSFYKVADMNTFRIEVFPKEAGNKKIEKKFKNIFQHNVTITAAKVYWISGEKITQENAHTIANEILTDHVSEQCLTKEDKLSLMANTICAEVSFRPGVTDNRAQATIMAIGNIFPDLAITVQTGDLYFFEKNTSENNIVKFVNEELSNSLLNTIACIDTDKITQWNRFQETQRPTVQLEKKKVEEINLNRELPELLEINQQKCWALNEEELRQIILHYTKKNIQNERKAKGLPLNPTDVEIEVIAQTWSEHCKHKIFASTIHYKDGSSEKGEKIESLYKSFIKKATYDVKDKFELDWLISVFSDNAGIIRFDNKIDVCVKVETHNSPSALDPYGGALTGILGVNRDILGCGIGAKPIANMDVFCFADESLTTARGVQLPSGLKDPSIIQAGVHKGVEDGGNKSGIPTVNGSIQYHDHYAGKPLVYVGTVGVMPQVSKAGLNSDYKGQKPGDYIVMAGGRIGADGIHGATFSSMELDDNAPATAVQIGDPFTQKKLMDFQLVARDQGLYTSVTDNGAGGLSSSIGEMAELSNGARIDLALAPTKYPGLSPYELMISESQERMSFAVSPDKWNEFAQLAEQYDVEVSNIGEFTNSGSLEVYYADELVADLNLKFLHDSLVPMQLEAEFDGPKNLNAFTPWHKQDFRQSLENKSVSSIALEVMALPNIRSKNELVSQYDQGVQGATLQGPFKGKSQHGPTDAAVIDMEIHGGDQKRGLVISNGMAPHLSYYDTYDMSVYAIDEAVRNIVATGGNPQKLALLDNFCWPDPIKGPNNMDYKYKCAQLVRSCKGLYDTAMIYGTPFISGKDSMKNDFIGKDENGNKVKISVPPTLLITAVSDIENTEKTLNSCFKQAGDEIFLLGDFKHDKYYASEFTKNYTVAQKVITPMSYDLEYNSKLYKSFHMANQEDLLQSAHDISEGGTLASVIESCFGNQMGCHISLNHIENETHVLPYLINEGTGCFIISAKKDNVSQLKYHFKDYHLQHIGHTTENNKVIFTHQSTQLINLTVDELFESWAGVNNESN